MSILSFRPFFCGLQNQNKEEMGIRGIKEKKSTGDFARLGLLKEELWESDFASLLNLRHAGLSIVGRGDQLNLIFWSAIVRMILV